MRIVFHDEFYASDYSAEEFDNAADPGRLEGVMKKLREDGKYMVVRPDPASRADLLRGHSEAYVASVESKPRLYTMAALAAGAAILAGQLALGRDPAFACLRPPGHHASRASSWGHCTFSNLALSLLRLRDEGHIRSAFVVDFDQHTCDGTIDVLRGWPQAEIYNAQGNDAADFICQLEARLNQAPPADIVAVSAGFDAYIHDLGRKLATDDFFKIGRLLQAYAIRLGHQRRFAVMEGGYYIPDLGKNVLAFCRGFE